MLEVRGWKYGGGGAGSLSFSSFLLFFFSYVTQPWSAEIPLLLANVLELETGTLFLFGFGGQGEDPGSTVVLSLAG